MSSGRSRRDDRKGGGGGGGGGGGRGGGGGGGGGGRNRYRYVLIYSSSLMLCKFNSVRSMIQLDRSSCFHLILKMIFRSEFTFYSL